ncbi:MAG: hypothetical protein WC120_05230 [Parcubacteria group bacterium]|jgi:hypothetical protein
MHVIAQCFAIGLGFATGLAVVAFALSASGKARANRHHAELVEQYARTEDRLVEYTRYMGVVAHACKRWEHLMDHPLSTYTVDDQEPK